MDGFREELLRLTLEQRRKRQRVDADMAAGRMTATPFGYAFASPDTGPERHRYPWRVTTCDASGRPIGHTNHATLRGRGDSARRELAHLAITPEHAQCPA